MDKTNEKNQQAPHRGRVERYLSNIKEQDGTLNAMMEVTPDIARAGADRADEADREGRSTGPLHGMIVALKDNIDTAGIRTTSGSRLFEEYRPEFDAPVWQRMQDAGAILIGKAGLHECVFGPTSQNVWFGRIRNPWNPDHIPGGSSGGSGSAVAAGYCDLALGTDTGGSVRIPSAMCGLTGLRPTLGAVSNRAVRPISPHLDTVGPMAKRVEDVARAFAVMQHYDPDDETSVKAPRPVDLTDIDRGVQGVRVGVPEEFFSNNLEPAVDSAYQAAIASFKELGANVQTISLPAAERASQVTPRIVVADAADLYQKDINERPELIGDEVMRRMSLGFDVTGLEYANNMRFMYYWRRQLDNVFNDVDVILTPTVSIPAPRVEESDDLLNLVGRITPFPMAWALGSGPTLAFPSGFSESGLPVSVQIAGPRFAEQRLFQCVRAFQSVTQFHEDTPPDYEA